MPQPTTKTPRTDAAWDPSDPLWRLTENERCEFARQLETELNEWRECATHYHRVWKTASLYQSMDLALDAEQMFEQLKTKYPK